MFSIFEVTGTVVVEAHRPPFTSSMHALFGKQWKGLIYGGNLYFIVTNSNISLFGNNYTYK